MTKLVIVESPSKAKTISKFLGKTYKVIASQGHVRDLPKSQLGIDTDNNFDMKYITIRGKGPLLAQIRKEAKAADKVFLATDPDREGEAISWHLSYILDIDPNSKCRVEFNEITKNAVKNALNSPRAIDIDRVDAQQARRALDRLVGYGISPILWAKVKKGLSAGRVQSVATRLVVERDKEIEDFIPEEYWDIIVKLGDKKHSFEAKLSSVDGKKPIISDKKTAENLEKRIKKAKFSISSIKNTEKKRSSTPPFITSTLQQAANSRLNFSTAKTMQVVQQLYEGISLGKLGNIGLVTYIRTDSVRVSEEAIASVRGYIEKEYGKDYLPAKAKYYKGRKNAQDAHEAIRPTNIDFSPESIKAHLTRDQYKLYNLIYTKFVASQMEDARYSVSTVVAEGDNIKLQAGSENLIFDGFMKLYKFDEKKNTETIPKDLKEGQLVDVLDVQKNQHFTEPKPHFTEASLVKELEDRGIGRPSTYAPTISTIISRAYVSREQKKLYATDLGIIVTELLMNYFEDVMDYRFTAGMEDNLDAVEEGTKNWHNLLSEFYPDFSAHLKIAEKEIEKVEIKDEESDVICEKCGRRMVYKMGKYGKFLACPGFPECQNTKPIVEYVDAKCPLCNGRIVKKTSNKRKRTFYGCENYPECKFVSWDMPSNEKCDKCGSYMVVKKQKNKTILLCSNKDCNFKKEI